MTSSCEGWPAFHLSILSKHITAKVQCCPEGLMKKRGSGQALGEARKSCQDGWNARTTPSSSSGIKKTEWSSTRVRRTSYIFMLKRDANSETVRRSKTKTMDPRMLRSREYSSAVDPGGKEASRICW